MVWVSGRSRTSTAAWARVRRAVLVRDGWRCACGAPASEVHHVVAVAEGGGDDMGNLVAICGPCHRVETARQAAAGRRRRAERGRFPVERHPGIV